MNKFAKFLKDNNYTTTSFAAKSGISQPMVCQLKTGKRLPSLATMVKIKKATGGNVGPQDWVK